MNDPYVEWITYKINAPDGIDYTNALPFSYNSEEFDLEISDGILTIYPKLHHESIVRAREKFDRFVKSWEVNSYLNSGAPQIRFEYDRINIVERNSPKNKSRMVHGEISLKGHVSGFTAGIVRKENYPEIPVFLN